jgi:hypothetical protein
MLECTVGETTIYSDSFVELLHCVNYYREHVMTTVTVKMVNGQDMKIDDPLFLACELCSLPSNECSCWDKVLEEYDKVSIHPTIQVEEEVISAIVENDLSLECRINSQLLAVDKIIFEAELLSLELRQLRETILFGRSE